MKTFIFNFLLLVISFFVLSGNVLAADLTLTCNGSACSPATSPALFPSSEIWYPGKTLTKTVNLTNVSGDPIDINITNSNISTTGDLDKVINITIKRVLTGVNIFSDSIENLNVAVIDLPSLANGSNEDYEFTANMDIGVGNEYQSKETKFDLLFNFTVGTVSSSSSSGGGSVAGASAPVCSDQKPGSAPTLLSAVAGVNTVTLNWSQANSPVSYYLVTYGLSPSNNTYGNPNVGGAGATSYTISGISGGNTYCFLVRAGNGCAPGDFSNQICATPSGGFVAGPASGFEEGVLGVASDSATLSITPEPKETGSVKGLKDNKSCATCIWWQILVGELIALFVYYYILIKDKLTKKTYLIGFIIPILSYIVFYILNRSCGKSFIFIVSGNIFCKYFILFDILLYGLIPTLKRMWIRGGSNL